MCEHLTDHRFDRRTIECIRSRAVSLLDDGRHVTWLQHIRSKLTYDIACGILGVETQLLGMSLTWRAVVANGEVRSDTSPRVGQTVGAEEGCTSDGSRRLPYNL